MSWIQSRTNRRLSPLALGENPSDIVLADIAHALSQICRFTGHTATFYSVAEHSLLVAQKVSVTGLSPERAKHRRACALLHDASEYVLGDVAAPIKRSAVFEKYRQVEREAERAIYARFGLAPDESDHDAIVVADLRALVTEAKALMPPHPAWEEIELFDGEIAKPFESGLVEFSPSLPPVRPFPCAFVCEVFLHYAAIFGLKDEP